MSQISKQFAIINKIKNLVKRTGSSLFGSNVKNSGITEEIAKKIQRNSYELSHKNDKDTYTPSYLIIAEQLQVSDDQIFKAAVFNLTNIAIATKKYSPAILSLLDKYSKDNTQSSDKREYIKIKMDEIKKNS